MDFRQSTQTGSGRPNVVTPTPALSPKEDNKYQAVSHAALRVTDRWMRVINTLLLVSIAALVAGIAIGLMQTTNNNESKFVQSSKYQAVFLNNGQVYFGNISSLNTRYVRLSNVYYLTQTGEAASSNYSLVKLGCQQIHDPLDQMLINRDQVTFWENLQNDGKVVKSINDFKKQNPNGPDCSKVTNQTQATGTAAQGTTPTPTTGTGTSNK